MKAGRLALLTQRPIGYCDVRRIWFAVVSLHPILAPYENSREKPFSVASSANFFSAPRSKRSKQPIRMGQSTRNISETPILVESGDVFHASLDKLRGGAPVETSSTRRFADYREPVCPNGTFHPRKELGKTTELCFHSSGSPDFYPFF